MFQSKVLGLLLAPVLALGTNVASAAVVSGAGASFPASIYKEWGKSYQSDAGIALNYDAIGSGGGIKKIADRSVNFGASDKPVKPDELEKLGLIQFPTVVGGVVPVINVRGIENGTLKLDGALLARIFMGKITKWNDPAIAALNPELKLPDATINVIHREEGSGTTFLFTHYLSQVSEEWKTAIGEGTLVDWKTGTACRTNLLIPVCLYKTENSISYMDYAFAAKSMIAMPLLKNMAGQFIAPNVQTIGAAASHAKWDPAAGFSEILTNLPGADSWPIVGATFILMHKTQENAELAKSMLKFFEMGYSNGGNSLALELGYIPLPKNVQNQIKAFWSDSIKDKSGKPICSDCLASR